MKKYKVTLTGEERQQLKQMIHSGKGAAQKLTHARSGILLSTGEIIAVRTEEV